MKTMTADEVVALHEDASAEQFGYSECYDYSPLLGSIATVELRVDEEEYQGDSWVIFRDGERWGYLEFGWGSCSGCDALQACESWQEVADLRNELATKVRWEPSRSALRAWFEDHDWTGDYAWSGDDFQRFLAAAKSLLAGEETTDGR